MLFSNIYKHSLHIVRKTFAFTCLFIYFFEYKVRIKAYKTYPYIQLLRCINLHYNHTLLYIPCRKRDICMLLYRDFRSIQVDKYWSSLYINNHMHCWLIDCMYVGIRVVASFRGKEKILTCGRSCTSCGMVATVFLTLTLF